jgi:hypothetical protein
MPARPGPLSNLVALLKLRLHRQRNKGEGDAAGANPAGAEKEVIQQNNEPEA